jgi:arginine kinase
MYQSYRDRVQAGNMSHKKVSADTLKNIQASLDILLNNESKSLLKKHLTKDIGDKIKDRETKYGGNLEVCARSGVKNLDSGVGLYACDPDAYSVFTELFDPLIKDYHKFDPSKPISHPASNFGNASEITALPFPEMVVSTRIRVGRSIDGFPFPPQATKAQRLKLEELAKSSLTTLSGELKGTYYPLDGMAEKDRKQLVDDHFLFKDDDKYLRDAGGYDDWPAGRGIYHNDDKTFLVWVNEEDHLRIISMQKGADIAAVFGRLKTAVGNMESKFPLAVHPNYGNLTFCPSNLGTGMRGSVHVRLPNVSKLECFKRIANTVNCDVRGTAGEHTASIGGVYDISNKRRLGVCEFDLVMEMVKGVTILTLLENDLAKIAGNAGQQSS